MKNLNITLFGDYFVGNSFSKIEIQNIYNYLKNNDLNIINYEGDFGKPVRKAVPLIMSDKSLDIPEQSLFFLCLIIMFLTVVIKVLMNSNKN